MKNSNRIAHNNVFLLLALLFLAQGVLARAGEAAVTAPPSGDYAHRESYSLPLFPGGEVLRNPNGGVAAFINLFPDTRIAGDAVLELWYSYSPIVIPDISAMTVSLNGTPLDSRILKAESAPRSSWSVKLPGELFRTGQNEIEIAVTHRTIDGLCRDIDNNANWFILRPETQLAFVVESLEYQLSSFPRPFSDPYSAAKINTVTYLPHDWDEDMLSAAMNLGSLLGQTTPQGAFPKRIQVRVGEPGQVEANEIVIGRTSDLLPELEEELGQPISPDVPVLALRELPNGFTRLIVAANESKALAKAVDALSRPQLVRTFIGDLAVLSSPLADAPPGMLAALFRDKRQLFSLKDFGYNEDIPVTGAFHQEAFIDVPRPPNYRAGDGSYIELRFRHSRILDPKKSAVTIYINDIPIRACALATENADSGVLRAPIPPSELSRFFWRVRFGFYHDLGIVDCSKRYDEVAWSVIEKETTVNLSPGKLPYIPVWENFAYDLPIAQSGRIELTMLLAEDNPSQSDFTTAFILSYLVGARNNNSLRWRVRTNPGDFDAETAPGTIIALGKNSGGNAWGSLSKYLRVYPLKEGFHVESGLDIQQNVLNDFSVCQISPVNGGKWLYSFMYKYNGRMNDLFAYSLRGNIPLSGQLSLVDEKGRATSLLGQVSLAGDESENSNPPSRSFFERLGGLFGGADRTIAIYMIVLGAVLLLTILFTFLARRRR